jgi:hypothetical protein
MITYIEGPRNVGKTYLLEHLNFKKEQYKFPFIDCNLYPNNEKFELGVSIAKDISLITIPKRNLIVDRGFLSSLVYGEIFNRYNSNFDIEKHINLLKKYLKNIKYSIIIITGKNQTKDCERNKDSKYFNELSYDVQLKTYLKYYDYFDNVVFFKNKFDKKSIIKFNNIVNLGVNNEYRKF